MTDGAASIFCAQIAVPELKQLCERRDNLKQRNEELKALVAGLQAQQQQHKGADGKHVVPVVAPAVPLKPRSGHLLPSSHQQQQQKKQLGQHHDDQQQQVQEACQQHDQRQRQQQQSGMQQLWPGFSRPPRLTVPPFKVPAPLTPPVTPQVTNTHTTTSTAAGAMAAAAGAVPAAKQSPCEVGTAGASRPCSASCCRAEVGHCLEPSQRRSALEPQQQQDRERCSCGTGECQPGGAAAAAGGAGWGRAGAAAAGGSAGHVGGFGDHRKRSADAAGLTAEVVGSVPQRRPRTNTTRPRSSPTGLLCLWSSSTSNSPASLGGSASQEESGCLPPSAGSLAGHPVGEMETAGAAARGGIREAAAVAAPADPMAARLRANASYAACSVGAYVAPASDGEYKAAAGAEFVSASAIPEQVAPSAGSGGPSFQNDGQFQSGPKWRAPISLPLLQPSLPPQQQQVGVAQAQQLRWPSPQLDPKPLLLQGGFQHYSLQLGVQTQGPLPCLQALSPSFPDQQQQQQHVQQQGPQQQQQPKEQEQQYGGVSLPSAFLSPLLQLQQQQQPKEEEQRFGRASLPTVSLSPVLQLQQHQYQHQQQDDDEQQQQQLQGPVLCISPLNIDRILPDPPGLVEQQHQQQLARHRPSALTSSPNTQLDPHTQDGPPLCLSPHLFFQGQTLQLPRPALAAAPGLGDAHLFKLPKPRYRQLQLNVPDSPSACDDQESGAKLHHQLVLPEQQQQQQQQQLCRSRPSAQKPPLGLLSGLSSFGRGLSLPPALFSTTGVSGEGSGVWQRAPSSLHIALGSAVGPRGVENAGGQQVQRGLPSHRPPSSHHRQQQQQQQTDCVLQWQRGGQQLSGRQEAIGREQLPPSEPMQHQQQGGQQQQQEGKQGRDEPQHQQQQVLQQLAGRGGGGNVRAAGGWGLAVRLTPGRFSLGPGKGPSLPLPPSKINPNAAAAAGGGGSAQGGGTGRAAGGGLGGAAVSSRVGRERAAGGANDPSSSAAEPAGHRHVQGVVTTPGPQC